MSDTFNFQRFWTYFKYDLRQLWRNHYKAVLVFGGAILIFYVLGGLLNMLTDPHAWEAPSIQSRFKLLIFVLMILELYQTHTYGYLTEKKAGSAWLMLPASRAEKYVSMLMITLVVIPVFFFTAFFGIDGILSLVVNLVDPTYGEALITGFAEPYNRMTEPMVKINDLSLISFSSISSILFCIVCFYCNLLFCLLCGICFKKNKTVGAIATMFGIYLILAFILIFLLDGPATTTTAREFTQTSYLMINTIKVLTGIITGGLAWGIWRRIKTLQH